MNKEYEQLMSKDKCCELVARAGTNKYQFGNAYCTRPANHLGEHACSIFEIDRPSKMHPNRKINYVSTINKNGAFTKLLTKQELGIRVNKEPCNKLVCKSNKYNPLDSKCTRPMGHLGICTWSKLIGNQLYVKTLRKGDRIYSFVQTRQLSDRNK